MDEFERLLALSDEESRRKAREAIPEFPRLLAEAALKLTGEKLKPADLARLVHISQSAARKRLEKVNRKKTPVKRPKTRKNREKP